ncbi:stage 0 sporulation regulatory protein [Evansella caseinilytica]|uniref:Stage 0 sporulation regulatory protein n=1 Tax=Evansella caseinilytica TaxID=1503961 RepID=A0A1H3QXT7_9BACI|nr:aspartyl-phosphate phosphatase Spo0E family protein [Evansella caseinilytica]SDZ17778.1 stage 0 sporulation regulatory protein [Evansella caseinilytica]
MGIQYYLKRQMEVKRKQMIRAAYDSGFTSQETVQYSQELDHLMNIYRRLTSGNSAHHMTKVPELLGYVN